MFELHPKLQEDAWVLGDFPLCRLLLMNEASYPWFILVPRREEITEIFQLDLPDQQQFWKETTLLAETLKDVFKADKLNVASLGNLVSQLHMHVIVRRKGDLTWPAPVWGQPTGQAYSQDEAEAVKRKLVMALDDDFKCVEAVC